MRAAILLALLVAGCAERGLAYDAVFEAVPGESARYTLKVLNATRENLTLEVAAPSAPAPMTPRGGDGVVEVRRQGAGTVVLVLQVDSRPVEAPSAVPTWTLRLEGLQRNTYLVDAHVTRTVCTDACRTASFGQVQNSVTVR